MRCSSFLNRALSISHLALSPNSVHQPRRPESPTSVGGPAPPHPKLPTTPQPAPAEVGTSISARCNRATKELQRGQRLVTSHRGCWNQRCQYAAGPASGDGQPVSGPSEPASGGHRAATVATGSCNRRHGSCNRVLTLPARDA
ncbi:uncharacterized protein LOC119322549 isoform X2 [Triticum dicoccoides]|uniref:uncharacterized protein LOC119322549 isoform X2 n=1 Tax=Triticum dicoccoides TaxID=85692 RepID=UPI001891D0B2|nr:uncharacterized protein LOC119322549 isoform X2 [Triticum dicoccoides]